MVYLEALPPPLPFPYHSLKEGWAGGSRMWLRVIALYQQRPPVSKSVDGSLIRALFGSKLMVVRFPGIPLFIIERIVESFPPGPPTMKAQVRKQRQEPQLDASFYLLFTYCFTYCSKFSLLVVSRNQCGEVIMEEEGRGDLGTMVWRSMLMQLFDELGIVGPRISVLLPELIEKVTL